MGSVCTEGKPGEAGCLTGVERLSFAWLVAAVALPMTEGAHVGGLPPEAGHSC